ncbi:MAG: N-acetylmuramoyl-L-alanine amidase [Acidobacteria bacterium]|nr:MAG: N-acetylmuramoyl-L-alanine amidase [Acidobacteriota bacterium]
MNSSQGQFGVSGDAPAGVRNRNPFHHFSHSSGNFFSIFFNKGFARVSPVFAVALLSLSSAVLLPDSFASNKSSSTNSPSSESTGNPTAAKRQSASSQFARAEEQRAALSSKPAEKRTLADYKQVVNTYRHVYLITPHASEVPDALVAVAELYSEMGERFGRSYFQSAVDTYQFLMREYPTSRYCQDAYLRSAKLQKDQLGDLSGASATYEAFLRKYPRSPHKREAQEARAELALLQNSAPLEAPRSAIARSAGSQAERTETQRRVISRDLPREAEMETARNEVRSGANEQGSAPAVNGHMPRIRKISAKSSQDSTRVTIELEAAVQYASGRIANPDRIYFDLHAARLTPQLAHGTIKTDGTILSGVRVAQNPSGIVRVVLDVNGVTDYSASLLNNPSRLVIDLYSNGQAVQTAKAGGGDLDSGRVEDAAVSTEKPEAKAQTAPTAAVKSAKADTDDSVDTMPQPKSKLGTAKIGKSGGKRPELVQPAAAPQPTRDGQSTLTRTLGLKIGRIVIDAGHGGHDTGTIGPTGLMEKDLCLDVALRLGKIIQQRLPGADVVFTRSDDTFIPLEERTHIANEAKADMFISIHANSSRDSEARGIETYYLNLKGSEEAMEVAARENATSDQGIHELQDLVKQIARTEKIGESKEFAEDVQDSLSKRVQKAARVVKNRGVRKAPFVVLIGADMPSILTEISFLSNPADEKMLKQPEHRQRVAEGIYQGVASYLQSLNSMGVNATTNPAPKRTATSASVESSRNRN